MLRLRNVQKSLVIHIARCTQVALSFAEELRVVEPNSGHFVHVAESTQVELINCLVERGLIEERKLLHECSRFFEKVKPKFVAAR